MNQTRLHITDPKKEQEDKTLKEKLELLLQDKKFVMMLLEDLKEKTDEWLNCYYQRIEETKKWNAKCEKYQPQYGLGDPIKYSKEVTRNETAIRIREGLGYPNFVAEICIEHQLLIPNDKIGYIVNEKLLEEKRGHMKETAKIGYEKIITGEDALHRQYERMRSVINIIKRLCNESTDGNAARSDIIREAEAGGMESSKVEDALARLKRNGQIYEPMQGKYRVTEY